METIFFFPLIDRLVCTIQNNQTLDALIKYVALYHSLYSDQIEVRLSLYGLYRPQMIKRKIIKLKWSLFIFDSYLSARSFANIDDNSPEHSSCLSLFTRSKLAKEEIYLNFRFREN